MLLLFWLDQINKEQKTLDANHCRAIDILFAVCVAAAVCAFGHIVKWQTIDLCMPRANAQR